MKNNPGAPLILTVPTGSPSKGTLLPASSIPGLVVGPLATVYVEPPAPNGRGNDATGTRGNAALPFATLQAAFAAMQNGDTLELAPGTYAPPSSPIPAALKSGSIQTSGDPRSVTIDATGTGLPALDFSAIAPGDTRDGWQIGTALGTSSFKIAADVGQPAIKADGTNAPAGTFFQQTIAIGAVLGGALAFKYVATCVIASPTVISPDTWGLALGGLVIVTSIGIWPSGHSIDVTVDTNDPKQPPNGLPGSGPGIAFLAGHWFSGTLTLKKQASLFAAPGVTLPDVVGSGLTVGPGPGFARTSIEAEGATFQGIDFASPGSEIPDSPAGNPTFNLRGAALQGSARFVVAAPAANQIVVNCNGAIVHADVQPGNGILATFRGTAFDSGPSNGGISTSGTGLCVPPDGAPIGDNAAGALVNTIPLPFAISGAYRVIPVADNAATLPLCVNNYTPTTCDITVAVAAGFLNGAIFMQ